uniref:RRM domain-containing protein n=1 Tax=Kalanchoe fedtschenkoi TaxID=63787 RepID=A0A7N0ZZ13_KALFE
MASKISPLDHIDSHVEMESLEGKFEEYGLGSGKGAADITLNGSIPANCLKNSSFHSRPSNGVLESVKVVIFSTKINLLIPFGPAAMLVKAFTRHHGWVFFLSLMGIIPLAERLGFVTEQLAFFTGPTVGGLLNATFGNATELIISIYALKTGMMRVVQQSLLGSILSNMLLVLGCAFFGGGLVHSQKEQVFNKSAAGVNSGLLLMAVMGLLFPAVLHFTHTELHYGKSELALSRFSSCVMLIAYAAYLYFQLKSQKDLYDPVEGETPNGSTHGDDDDDETPEISKWESIVWLAILTICISVLSEYLVDAIEGASVAMNIPIAFISVILLPIVGNAAEHASAIMFAMKDKLDISLGVAIGSSTQISMFGIPFCVVVGWTMGRPMDLNFQLFETAALFMTVLVVAFMLQEGTSNYFKGLMLILCYVIVAASFFVHVDPKSIGGDRFRSRRDFPPRSDDSKSQRVNAPPSRHLWVGNLPLNIDERTLADQFDNFGELESLAFQPGRTYAFVNFKREEEAIAAMRALQGFPLGGHALKIEFTKADKSSASSRGQDYSQRQDYQRPVRDSRTHNDIIEPNYSDKSRMNEKDEEPCEVLWIGFPATLRIDEVILRKAFSPFGEIEKITAFPGRSYAFVQFRDIMSACRAKETLHGKLFGNPRVHICFAKSDSGSSHGGRSSSNLPPSPATHFKYNVPPSFPLTHDDRIFPGLLGDPNMRSPSFLPNGDHGYPDAFGYSRDGSFLTAGQQTLEKRKFSEMESDLRFSEDRYERRRSPIMERDPQFPGYSPQRVSRRSPLYEEPWDIPEDKFQFHGTKKSKMDPLTSEKELPEYHVSGFEYGKPVSSRVFPDNSNSRPLPIDRFSEPLGSFGYKLNADHSFNIAQHHQEGRNKSSYDSFQSASGNLPQNPLGQNNSLPEPRVVSKKEWKWEGTIAKSGTPVCRARCFPVGKVMDNFLPSILDCTARTGLEMLAKHFYSAADSWVVFFAPQSDADIGFYDEFMHYLEEKQRAAVAKLDDLHTLFLVPPSEFSEKVLKVPGKLSISGLILRLEHPVINFGSTNTNDKNDASSMHFPGDLQIPR